MNTVHTTTPIAARPGLRGHDGLTQSPSALRCFVYCRKSTEDDNRQVASIGSQRQEIDRAFGARENLQIVQVYEEARSAKTPGRPIFGEMLARIERGEADCIVAWAPDRLARNSIDGGRIIYLLDQGVLRDLRFATYTFENNSQGKFMLSIMFGQSKYYSDALSENVKRGNRTKAAKGWRPNSVPLGYRHDPATKTITVDPIYLPLIRRMFDLMLTGGYSARKIARLAQDEWGLRTPGHWKRGGRPLAPSTIHRVLTNPFYAGIFMHEGQVREGAHEPTVTMQEFDAVQATLRRPSPIRPQHHSFPFTGLIRCGRCGRVVTAEHKTNRHGKRYIYYHCSKSGLGPRCPEPSVRAEALEGQISAWLRSLAMAPNALNRLHRLFETKAQLRASKIATARPSLERALRDAQAQITELTGMRIRNLISDEEFVSRRAGLQEETIRLARRLAELATPENDEALIPPLTDAISFSNYAAFWFENGDDDLRRLILKTTCSNPTLSNKILSIDAAKWLSLIRHLVRCRVVRGYLDTVRTLIGTDEQFSMLRSVVRMKEVARGIAA